MQRQTVRLFNPGQWLNISGSSSPVGGGGSSAVAVVVSASSLDQGGSALFSLDGGGLSLSHLNVTGADGGLYARWVGR